MESFRAYQLRVKYIHKKDLILFKKKSKIHVPEK